MSWPAGVPWSIFQQGGGSSVAARWAADLLADIGAPQTPGNIQVIYDWEKSEGGGGAFNPLNAGPDPMNASLTSTGQQFGGGAANYNSWQAGLQGTTDILEAPGDAQYGYPAIISALKANNPAGARQAIWNSQWAASHYGYGTNWSNAAPPGAANQLPNVTLTSASQTSATTTGFNWTSFLESGVLGELWPQFRNSISDDFERIGLVIFGALLILLGIGLIGIGPASKLSPMLGKAAQAKRNLSTLRGPSEEVKQERQGRLQLAERNTALGERKQKLREERFAASSSRRKYNRPAANKKVTGSRKS